MPGNKSHTIKETEIFHVIDDVKTIESPEIHKKASKELGCNQKLCKYTRMKCLI